MSCDEQKAIPAHVRARIKPQFDIISTCIDQTEYFKREGVLVIEKQIFWALFERYKHSPQYKHSVAHDKIEEWLSGEGEDIFPISSHRTLLLSRSLISSVLVITNKNILSLAQNRVM